MVITGLTRNQFAGNSGTWVRIPPAPPNSSPVWRAVFYEKELHRPKPVEFLLMGKSCFGIDGN